MTYRSDENPAELDPALADRIAHWLMQSYDVRRYPTVTANVLAVVVDLAIKDAPFPQREPLAAMLGCSKFSIDAALNTAMERGIITIELRTAEGNITNRPSVVQQRYFKPSSDLWMLAGRTSKGKPNNPGDHGRNPGGPDRSSASERLVRTGSGPLPHSFSRTHRAA